MAGEHATPNRAQTFDNRTLGPIRRRPSTTAPYDMPSTAVIGRLFFPGPNSPEALPSLRQAVQTPEAMHAVEAYAVDRLRKAALREDGTLDPAKVAAWRRSHADALRSLPDLDARFADAARASETMERVAVGRKRALDEAQAGALGRLVGAELTAVPVASIDTSNKSGGAGHSSSSANPDDRTQDEDGFAAGVVDLLNKQAVAGKLSALIVIAAPKTLGEMRKHYHAKLKDVLLGEVSKDLTGQTSDDIENAIAAS